jgi:hypothetical protein
MLKHFRYKTSFKYKPMARNSGLTFLFIHKVVCFSKLLTKHHDILCLAECPVDLVSWKCAYHYDAKSSHVPSCSTLHQGQPDTSAWSDRMSIRPRRTVQSSVSWHAVKITYPFYTNILIPLKFLFPEDNNGWCLKIQTFWKKLEKFWSHCFPSKFRQGKTHRCENPKSRMDCNHFYWQVGVT